MPPGSRRRSACRPARRCGRSATSAGLATLIVASERVFLALKLVGAAYLVYLGLQSLARAVRRRAAPHPAARAPRLDRRAAFRQGALSNLGNPKMAVFFTSLLPQFAHGGAFLDLLGLGLLFVRAHGRLAHRVRAGGRASLERPSPPGRPPGAGRGHRLRARRAGPAARDRAALARVSGQTRNRGAAGGVSLHELRGGLR